GAHESSLQRAEVLARGLDRDGVLGGRRAQRDGARERRGNRPRWHRAHAVVPPRVPGGTGAKGGRSRARPLLQQRNRNGARRPHVGRVTRSRPRQHVLLHLAAARGLQRRSSCGGSRMRRRRLLGIGCALVALALVPAAPPVHAQLPGLPPVIVPAPPPVIVPAPPPVIVPAPLPVIVQSLIADKIDPALLALMAADPQKLLPVIVEMQAPLPPFFGAPNVDRALEALNLLRFSGVAVAPLSLLDSAAGFANAAGIGALSLLPTVAFIHHDATVGPQPNAAPPVPPATADQVSAVYPRVVRADKVWQQGIAGGGVTVAILDSGIQPDADLVQPDNRILASVNFADQRLTSDPGGHGTHIAGIVAGNGTRSGGQFTGIAPQANVVDVRVLGSTGSGRISSVIRGIEWVLAHRAAYNIRVINLSFGAPARLPYRLDPMS